MTPRRGTFFITTPIYYINDKPHIGSFYCTLMADAVSRWHRLKGDEVLFSTGTDENSQKILPVAAGQGLSPAAFVEGMSRRWQETWKKLDLSFDRFIRTTSPEHHRTVKAMFERWLASGDVYKKRYSGLYCVGCERFIKESELENGVCPDHRTRPQRVEEENYFFRLSKYQDRLQALLERSDFALPEFRRNEMIRFVKDGLEDISLSRASLDWGIPLPSDPTHVFYVWFDALVNYLSVLGYGSDDLSAYEKFWTSAVHLVGKEIFRFHTVIWPAMLMSAGVPLPKAVFGHGFFTVDGQKISKSIGNTIDPLDLADRYGLDTLRFYTLCDTVFGRDSDFSTGRLEEIHNSFLANDYGNLLNRTLNMIERYSGGTLAGTGANPKFDGLRQLCESAVRDADRLYDTFQFDELIRRCFGVIGLGNKLIDEYRPWDLAARGETQVLNDLLSSLFESLRVVTLLLNPVIPHKTAEIFSQLGVYPDLSKIDLETELRFSVTPQGHRITRGAPVFPRIEKTKEKTMSDPTASPTSNPTTAGLPSAGSPSAGSPSAGLPSAGPAVGAVGVTPELIKIDDFKKIKLVVGSVKSSEKVANADKLLKLVVDIGSEERVILSGIAEFYKPEDLVARRIVVITNLEPRKIRGEVSHGMLLAARDANGLSIVTLDREVAPGSPVS